MNENKDSFGLDSIQPLETTSREPVGNSTVFETGFYVEPKAVGNEEETQYAFTPEEFVVSDVSTELSEEVPVEENSYNFYEATPIAETVSPTNTAIPAQEISTSFTEMSTAVEQSSMGSVNEHPDAIISLHKSGAEENVVSSRPEEKVDKSTIVLLVCLFLGMLFVIILLPYFL